jgi:hypothetical protein
MRLVRARDDRPNETFQLLAAVSQRSEAEAAQRASIKAARVVEALQRNCRAMKRSGR